MRSMSGSDDKGGGDDEGERKWRWPWTEVTMKKKVNGNDNEGISVRWVEQTMKPVTGSDEEYEWKWR